jgi:hypothetical protein
MAGRIELRTDIALSGGIRGLRRAGESRSNEAGKKFAIDLDKSLGRHREIDQPAEDCDKIVIRQVNEKSRGNDTPNHDSGDTRDELPEKAGENSGNIDIVA